jgi:hypothetical protein
MPREALMNYKRPLIVCFLAVLAVIGAIGQRPAVAAIVMDLTLDQNGTPPTKANASLPYGTAEFVTNGVGDVSLTMDLNLAGAFVRDWLFSVVDGVDASLLTFTYQSGLSTGSAATSITQHAAQDLNGGSNVQAGFFNIQFYFGNNDFENTEHVVYQITGQSITENSFLKKSGPDTPPPTNTGGFYTAADFAGYGSSGSVAGPHYTDDPVDEQDDPHPDPGPHPIPEPSSMLAWALGLAFCAAGLRKRRQNLL